MGEWRYNSAIFNSALDGGEWTGQDRTGQDRIGIKDMEMNVISDNNP
jgi:hypothetical protein